MTQNDDVVMLAADLTTAWLSNPHTRTTAEDVPAFLASMHKAVLDLAQRNEPEAGPEPAQTFQPKVSARQSLASPEHIVSMIDGKKYRTLRRHLNANGLTPDQYRERYKLKPDYPMVAPAYSASRSTMAKSMGLGRKAGTKVEKVAEGAVKTVRKSGKAALAAAKKALGTDN